MITYVRHSNKVPYESRKPDAAGLGADHPCVGNFCIACDQLFLPGDLVTLIPLGPGNDKEDRLKAARGGWYSAVAAIIHWACATGDETV